MRRSNWLIILSVSILLLFAFAIYNGNKNVEKRLYDISVVQEKLHKEDSEMLATLKKIEAGEQTNISYRRLPSEPMNIGYRHPRLAIMQPETLSFLATGQSDMYTHFKSPKIYGNNFALDYSEMVSPVQLLFGNFDLAFVIIYILPLLIIAFTFNILSKEKELGTLRIIGAQPISIVSWLLQKMIIRYMVFTLVVFGILLITLITFTANAFTQINQVLQLFLIIAGYNLFWFVVAAIVNIKINNSSKNALALIGVWLLIVLVLPATINQIGNSLYPIPSRLNMINEIRSIKKENEEKQNEIMDDYMRNHPELSQDNSDQKFGFWHNYFASEKMMEEKTKPILAEYESQLKKQQNLISTFRYMSPAILMQQTLNNIAGTSEKHYNDYKIQVFEFSTTWRNYLVPMLFKNQKFTQKNYHELPEFHYKNRIETNFWLNLFAIIGINTILFFVIIGKGLKSNPILK
ncbi:MAG: DUF3526 domain-containing protein [Polaribacter sp.]|uniref:DUF3526 domain-containing protein n=1 Tax=Polaribacter sp. TaxID=1920175 RepID=UPI003265D4B3